VVGTAAQMVSSDDDGRVVFLLRDFFLADRGVP
jgi:hypothetical protein